VEERSIDWGSAQVTAKGDLLELRVPLIPGEVGLRWDEIFNSTAQRREREARGQEWSGVHAVGRWIVVDVVAQGAEKELRAYLDELVQLTDREAGEARGRQAEAEKEQAERAESQKTIAEEMTQRFREDS
jgi:hypothetical protein